MSSQTTLQVSEKHSKRAIRIVRFSVWVLDHWIGLFSFSFGLLVFMPFLAPVLMHFGLVGPADLIYFVYSFLCHQMSQRSFFLFGSHPMYNIAQLPIAMTGNESVDTLALRAFIGNSALGWKVAWSDRMVYMYGGIWLAGLLFKLMSQRNIKRLGIVGIVTLLMPMAIDGGTHFLSDVTGGLTGGFRYNNQWLSDLTQNVLPSWFYVGDAFGSFNAWMRLISGLAFGFMFVWLAFPILKQNFQDTAQTLREKLSTVAA